MASQQIYTTQAASNSQEIFSLVPGDAQRAMYSALRRLQALDAERTGAEVVEIAAGLALRETDAVVACCGAHGTRQVRTAILDVADIPASAHDAQSRFELATTLAVSALFPERERLALVCCGALEPNDDLRPAMRFAGDHKLPILYVVANRYERGKARHDFRTFYAEFGVPALTVDASDPIAAFRVITEAAHNARFQRGATLIDVLQVSSSRKPLASPDPLRALENYMRRHNTWKDELRQN